MSGFAQHAGHQTAEGTWRGGRGHPELLTACARALVNATLPHSDTLAENNKTVAFPYCCSFLILNVVVIPSCAMFQITFSNFEEKSQ